jgi:hypothetical protein
MIVRSLQGRISGCLAVAALLVLTAQAQAQDAGRKLPTLPEKIGGILANRCLDCHGEDEMKGDVRLDNFETLSPDEQTALLNRVEEQVYLRQMPPSKKKQLTDGEWEDLTAWISGGFESLDQKSKFRAKLRYPKFGNYVNHGKLFSGESKEKAFTPGRRWLISPYIFTQKVREFYAMEEKDIVRYLIRRFVKNPFKLSDDFAVHYFDNEQLGEGHLNTILSNAMSISRKQLEEIRIKLGLAKVQKTGAGGGRYKDEWYPPTLKVFADIVSAKELPDDKLLGEAIRTQFDLVLRRPPTDGEMREYLDFTRESVRVGGNSQGLQQMLIAVWMEEEIYYRSEFGAGPADEYGRRMLAPEEAAFAIAYALSDVRPDETLMTAAREGHLNTREDYKREVLRLLADTSDPRPVSAELWHGRFEVPNPRTMRFFRDFLAYPKAGDIFKDNNRYWGYDYRTVARDIVKEADLLLEHFLKLDQNVIENILGSDKYYVFHNGDNGTIKRNAGRLKTQYTGLLEKVKDVDWRKDPAKTFIEKGLMRSSGNGRKDNGVAKGVARKIKAAEDSVGKGNRPLPYTRFDLGPHMAPRLYVYNLDEFDCDYEPVQPVSLPNRKGFLTHPAWLIAHSKNTATDPIVRGHFIQERLLAGTVPDVPISVDAVIPEDPHRNLRDRLESVTMKKSCWECHEKMNPLGLPFEMYDDFGHFRTEEALEYPENLIKLGSVKPNVPNTYKTVPIRTDGALSGTGDPALDGKVTDAIDLIGRLEKSERVRQSIIRHAFRYYMGRNEMLSDSQTLIDADNAYVESGGSFKAVVVSLLTSDSFIYRKDPGGADLQAQR